MIRKSVKITSCIVVCAVAFSGMGLSANAATSASFLPSGGVGYTLAEGNDLGNKTSSKTNTNLNTNTNTNTNTKAQTSVAQTNVEQAQEDLLSEEALEAESFKNLVIAQVTNYVNVRSLPSEEGEIIGKLYDSSVGTFIEEENGWYKIQSGTVTGYVKGEFCVTGEDAVELARKVGVRIAKVTTQTLKVRMEPGLEAKVLGLVPLDDELVVKDETEGWVQVDTEEGIGWVSKDYVSLHSEFVQAESKEEEQIRLAKEEAERKKAREAAAAAAAKNTPAATTVESAPVAVASVSEEGSEMGRAVADYALQFVGNPYVYGGTSLTNGADCSGFVMSVYSNFGVSLPHSSSADRSQGYAVEGGIENAQPGDILCYSGHVAIYIGNGQIVHASTESTGIIVSSAYYKQTLAVRRVF